MNVGTVIDAHTSAFGTLLLPQVQTRLEEGEPLTVLGLVEEEIACGALAGLWLDEAFQILSLYIAPEHRRKGGGRLLIKTLVTALTQLERPTNLEIAYTETMADHKVLTLFLEALGFHSHPERHPICTATLEELGQSPFFKTAAPNLSGAIPLNQMPEVLYKNLVRKFQMLDDDAMVNHLQSLALNKHISVVYQGQRDDLAFILMDELAEDHICLAMALSAQPTVLAQLLRMVYSLTIKHYPKETKLTIQTVNESSVGLMEKLLPQAQVASRRYNF
ncbi:MAG: GNAT family N-acetyltransferase [Eubacteriales bacterium]